MIELVSVNDQPPFGLEEMLHELGTGENGFAGTPVGVGEQSLDQFIVERRKSSRGEDLRSGWVPQTTYWIVVEGQCAGILRLRHYLNESLRKKGGHIGYYVRAAFRGMSVATTALGLALPLAKALGETRVMLTTSPDNVGSIRVIERNNGVLAHQYLDEETGELVLQFWIELD